MQVAIYPNATLHSGVFVFELKGLNPITSAETRSPVSVEKIGTAITSWIAPADWIYPICRVSGNLSAKVELLSLRRVLLHPKDWAA
jgi:hypothetical protein